MTNHDEVFTAPPSPNDALLWLENVVAELGTFRVELRGFGLPRLGITALVGLNGAGKTAVCDVIGGEIRPTRGRVVFEGKDIGHYSVDARASLRIGRKFQDKRLSPDCTVLENMELAAPLHGLNGVRLTYAEARARINTEIKRMRLVEVLQMRVAELSGGQQQRLALARLILREPKLLLIDEPTAGLSSGEKVETLQVLRELGETCSVLLIAHDIEFVKEISARLAVIDKGRLLGFGPSEHVIVDPQVRRLYPRRAEDVAVSDPLGDEPGECVLTTTGLTVSYGGVHALRAATLQFFAGTITGIFGQNGAGKTTLLRAIMHTVIPDEGTVNVFGRDVSGLNTPARAKTGIAMAGQGQWNGLFPDMTIYDNMRVCLDVNRRPASFPARIRRLLRNDLASRSSERDYQDALPQVPADETIDAVFQMPQFNWMSEAKEKKVAVLSGGERQQVSIACALLARPRVLLLDEPTFGVDEPKQSMLLELFRSIARGECGLTPWPVAVVLVEQQVPTVRPYVDRFYLLERGSVVRRGTRSQLTDHVIEQFLGG